ncbi:MAG: DNA/pantothenate metabolism flavoprotein domain protein [Verrucomicrobia bacterium]|nr:MAG: DNA/pantothenate metabolism flavoprotein domain protein [Verrucomicrobiota bacterium]
MKCVVTAGPTYEPLDEVRRLTNFSTGKLGTELSNFLTGQGHEVVLLLGYYAIYRGEHRARRVETFTTTADLHARLQALSTEGASAVFHAAAVSDFSFGEVWERKETGELVRCVERKISTRKGQVLVELKPTPKIIGELRGWFPQSRLVGWKYELDGGRSGAVQAAERQIAKNRTNACVVNGAAYGDGFGLVTGAGKCEHLADAQALYGTLARLIAC